MEKQRICTMCKVIKPFSEFNWHKEANLPYSRCKPCFNEICRVNRQSKKGKESYRKWVSSQRGKEVRANAIKKWRAANKNKRDAHTKVSNALRDGRLVKQPCRFCNDPITEAHHHSYEEKDWLIVTWLCKKHHTLITYRK